MSEDLEREFERDFSESGSATDTVDQGVGIAWGLVAFLALVVLLVAFITQNPERVTVEFLWFDLRLSIWVIVIAIVLITLALDQIISYFYRRRKRRRRAETAALKAND